MTITREFVSTVHIVRNEKVLLTWNRKVNNWVPVGGHIELNELPCESVIREAKEETGLDIEIISKEVLTSDNLSQPISIHLDYVKEDHQHINLIYFGKVLGGECFEFDDEGKELRWFSKEELDNPNMLPNVREWGIKAIDFFKNKTRQPKKIGVGVGVMILNKEGKILLGLRSEDKNGSAFKLTSCWTMPGGKLEYEENFEECAKREVLEETGIELKNIKVICVNDNKNEHARYVTIGFLSENCEATPKIMEPDEIIEWKWFDLNDLPENMYFPSTKLLENYKQNKFYIQPKNIEIEVRAFITQEKYQTLLEFFKQNSELVKEDLQETHYLDCEQDIRIQKNNFDTKIWMKKGKIHDDAREEIEIRLNKESFENMKEIFCSAGLATKIKWIRDRKQFNWNKIKVCLDYTKGYGYVLELEKIGSEENKEIILEELKQKMNELNIVITPKEEFDAKYNYYKENWRALIKCLG